MPTPIEIVTAFSAAFPEDGGKVAIRHYFTPKTAYVNEGVSKTIGIEEAIAFLERPIGRQALRQSTSTCLQSPRTEIAC